MSGYRSNPYQWGVPSELPNPGETYGQPMYTSKLASALANNDWRWLAGPHVSGAVDNAGRLARLLMDTLGPQADVQGMVNDAGAGNQSLASRDYVGALNNYGSAAAAIPMMFLPGTVSEVKQGIRAFHSSPHNFDKFDISKIGTGEGAQVYGHGLYAAESPSVSGRGGAYDRQFTARNLGKHDLNQQEEAILRLMTPDRTDADVLYELHRQGSIAKAADGLPDFDQAEEAIKRIRESKSNIYEVNIKANPDDFLDWDKPLSQQPESVRDVLSRFGAKDGEVGQQSFMRVGKDTFPIMGDDGRWKAGGNTYEESLSMVGGDPRKVNRLRTSDSAKRSEVLREAGIPGIKYLDQGSRGITPPNVEKYRAKVAALEQLPKTEENLNRLSDAQQELQSALRAAGEISSNYVVFDDSLIEILRKYGLAGLLMGGAGAASYGGNEE